MALIDKSFQLAGVGLLWVIFGLDAGAQQYPRWFIHPRDVPCSQTAVGYVRCESPHIDSAIQSAMNDGLVNYARSRFTRVSGGRLYLKQESGTFWADSDEREAFDTAALAEAAGILHPIDTLLDHNIVFVLLGDPACTIDKALLDRESFDADKKPLWTRDLPHDSAFLYAVGLAPGYFYEVSSWQVAEQSARRNLACSILSKVKSVQYRNDQTQTGVQNVEGDAILHNARILERWRDLKEKIFYVLIGIKQ